MSDELFSIPCTTCNTRLRVRDASVIGHILACPKCGGMVLVERPASQGAAPATKPSDSRPHMRVGPVTASESSQKETLSDGDFGDVDSLLGTTPPQKATPKAAPKTTTQASAKTAVAASPPPPADEAAHAATAHAVPTDWVSPQVKRFRYYALLAAGSVMGIALAMGVGYLAVQSRGGDPTTPIAENPADTPVEEIEKPMEETPPLKKPPEESPALPEETIAKSVDPIPMPMEKPLEPPPEKPEDDPLQINVKPPVKPEDADDPLKLNELRKMSQLLGEGTDVVGSATDSGGELPKNPEAVKPSSPSRPRPEQRKIDFAARMNDRIPEIKFDGTKLSDVVQFLTDFSTIPISIDPEALLWSRIDPTAPVKAQLTNATVQDVLTEAGKAYKLEPIVVGEQLVLTRGVKPRTIKYPIGDLCDAKPESVAAIVDLIVETASPESWEKNGGEGKMEIAHPLLTIEQTDAGHRQILLLCEKLRVARGGSPRSTLPAAWFALDRRSVRAAAKLRHPLTLNFSRPTLLTKILKRFEEESGVKMVIDWQALAEAEWPTDSDATVTVEKSSLAESLAKLLEPMDLTYRVVDDSLIQITSWKGMLDRPEIEVYRLPTAISPENAEAQLTKWKEALGSVFFREQGGVGVLRLDSKSNAVIALLPQTLQNKLADLISQTN